jgi:hypothetical protein
MSEKRNRAPVARDAARRSVSAHSRTRLCTSPARRKPARVVLLESCELQSADHPPWELELVYMESRPFSSSPPLMRHEILFLTDAELESWRLLKAAAFRQLGVRFFDDGFEEAEWPATADAMRQYVLAAVVVAMRAVGIVVHRVVIGVPMMGKAA